MNCECGRTLKKFFSKVTLRSVPKANANSTTSVFDCTDFNLTHKMFTCKCFLLLCTSLFARFLLCSLPSLYSVCSPGGLLMHSCISKFECVQSAIYRSDIIYKKMVLSSPFLAPCGARGTWHVQGPRRQDRHGFNRNRGAPDDYQKLRP